MPVATPKSSLSLVARSNANAIIGVLEIPFRVYLRIGEPIENFADQREWCAILAGDLIQGTVVDANS